jgi:hypothetical protein
MNRIIANLLIILAFMLLGLAYRLKRRRVTVRQLPRRRRSPGRWATMAAALSIVFVSARFGLVGV